METDRTPKKELAPPFSICSLCQSTKETQDNYTTKCGYDSHKACIKPHFSASPNCLVCQKRCFSQKLSQQANLSLQTRQQSLFVSSSEVTETKAET